MRVWACVGVGMHGCGHVCVVGVGRVCVWGGEGGACVCGHVCVCVGGGGGMCVCVCDGIVSAELCFRVVSFGHS